MLVVLFLGGGGNRPAGGHGSGSVLGWIPLIVLGGALVLLIFFSLWYVATHDNHRFCENEVQPGGSNQSQTTSSSQQSSQISYEPPQEWLTPPVSPLQQQNSIQMPLLQQTNVPFSPASPTIRTACGIELSSFELRSELGEEACPVCLEQLNMQRVSCGPCSHYVHSECLKRWLSKDKSKSCPVCRTNYET